MSCNECKHSPKTYEEYCMGQKDPSTYCPDAHTERAHLCGNYDNKEKDEEKKEEIKEELEI